MHGKRYPKIQIRSKNEFAKHINGARFPFGKALSLVGDVRRKYDVYWKDNISQSNPDKGKYVRSAKGTPLGQLLDRANKYVLAPHDKLLPEFIFGGVNGLNHKAAVQHLLGHKRKRTLLKLDVNTFFEQVEHRRVYHLFRDKCGCSDKGSKMLANLCCVPQGPKDKPAKRKTLARGFATSSRLAVWCNLDAFIRLERVVNKRLRGKDPKIAVYVDDIGITASNVTVEEMLALKKELICVLTKDHNQSLPLNNAKTRVVTHTGETYDESGAYMGRWQFEHLGIVMKRNSLTVGTKTRKHLDRTTARLKKHPQDASTLKQKRDALRRYKAYIEAD